MSAVHPDYLQLRPADISTASASTERDCWHWCASTPPSITAMTGSRLMVRCYGGLAPRYRRGTRRDGPRQGQAHHQQTRISSVSHLSGGRTAHASTGCLTSSNLMALINNSQMEMQANDNCSQRNSISERAIIGASASHSCLNRNRN